MTEINCPLREDPGKINVLVSELGPGVILAVLSDGESWFVPNFLPNKFEAVTGWSLASPLTQSTEVST